MDFGYKVGLFGIVVVVGFLVSMAFQESPFPPVDHSSSYEYGVQDGGVYIRVVKHDEYTFISQFGIWHSATPELVKRNKGHDAALGLSPPEFETNEEYQQVRQAYNIWEAEYNNAPENQVDLSVPNTMIRIPANKNPYDWKPDPESWSF